MADRVNETIVLAADREAVLGIITHFESYPDWQPQMQEAEVLERDGEGRATTVRYKFKGQMFTANYTLAYTYDDQGLSFTAVEGDILKTLDGRYTLVEEAPGKTRVTYELEASPAIKIPAVLRRQGAKKMIEDLFSGLQERLEG
jgi:ribosome-associated toxin RatA of RatAB toxin-antitoxin module